MSEGKKSRRSTPGLGRSAPLLAVLLALLAGWFGWSAVVQWQQADDGTRHRGRSDEAQLKQMIEDHARLSGSERAQEILADWAKARGKFVKVFPNEYRRALKELEAARLKEAA